MGNRVEIDLDMLENVAGGAIGFNPDNNGTYTMKCQFTGLTFSGVRLDQIMQIAQYAASIPNTLEGEQQIIDWAREQKIIN